MNALDVDPLRVYVPPRDGFGRDGYPVAWHDLGTGQGGVKDLVRELAGNRCVRCGHPYAKGAGEWSRCDERCAHGAPYRLTVPEQGTMTVDIDEPEKPVTQWLAHGVVHARWRILTVHHLNADKADLRWWNLAALCQRCHLQIQNKVVMGRVWPWPHSEWFKPYAAGWYAWAYLGEDLTREEAEARLDELLALEGIAA